MHDTKQLIQILTATIAALGGVFFLALKLHRSYRHLPDSVRIPLLLIIHVFNCVILLVGFFAAENLHDAYIGSHHLSTEVIQGGVTFVLFFILGIPFIFFYIRSQTISSALEEENVLHKLDLINFLNSVMEVLPADLHQHGTQTGLLVKNFCDFLQMKKLQTQNIVFAALFHNIGSAFANRRALGTGEDECDRQVNLSASLFYRSRLYKQAANIIQHQLEKWDGSGKPDELRGVDIPLGSRMIAIASMYERLVNGRGHQLKLSVADALAKLEERGETELDPYLLDQFKVFILKSSKGGFGGSKAVHVLS